MFFWRGERIAEKGSDGEMNYQMTGYGGESRAAPPQSPAVALPATLISSFFAEESDADCRSFSQLLAGVMTSSGPPIVRRNPWSLPAEEEREGAAPLTAEAPPDGTAAAPPFFALTPGLFPAALLDSPSLFAPGPECFGISHKEALANVTAQADASWGHAKVSTGVLEKGVSLSRQKTQAASLVMENPSDDGYNWKKYGQKVVKGSECPRSYYKCTHSKCSVKKKVERSLDGQVAAIIYKGEHNHPQPPPSKRATEVGSTQVNKSIDSGDHPPAGFKDEVGLQSQRQRGVQEPLHALSEHSSGSRDDEEEDGFEEGADEESDAELDPKRRKVEAGSVDSKTSQRMVTKPKIIVQTQSKVDLLDDGYRWRKYGQKVVKGNFNPRSYYKCTSAGCNVRKHIERAPSNPEAVITTYEGKHNHNVPVAKNNSHKPVKKSSSVLEGKEF